MFRRRQPRTKQQPTANRNSPFLSKNKYPLLSILTSRESGTLQMVILKQASRLECWHRWVIGTKQKQMRNSMKPQLRSHEVCRSDSWLCRTSGVSRRPQLGGSGVSSWWAKWHWDSASVSPANSHSTKYSVSLICFQRPHRESSPRPSGL
jgi:hypothetical protein